MPIEKPTRRTVIKAGVVAGATAAIGAPRLLTSPAEAAVIDPTTIPKYVTPLFIMPAMPTSRVLFDRDEYSVGARRFTQQILPAGLPATTVFGFGSTLHPSSFHTPGYTIEARVNRPNRVAFVNQLMTGSGDYVPSLTTVDPTLHWANPPGGVGGRDTQPDFSSTPAPYTGPVPLVVHLHGERSFEESDGYPEAWYLPNARNIPSGYARVGSFYDRFRSEAQQRWGVNWQPGSALFVYPNDQRAGTNWFHDHSLGMTRNNVYSGLAAYYLLRGGSGDTPSGVLPGPAPQRGDQAGRRYYEIPLVLQDKSFNTDGTLSFPTNRADTTGPFIPETDIPPYWNPVFLANTIAVNGNTWPFLTVEARRYRFRLLNASNIRPYTLKVVSDPLAARPTTPALPLWLIGSDGGFMPRPVQLQQLPIFPAERYDIIIDFTNVAPGTTLYLTNEGGGSVPATTGQVMQFRVVARTSTDTTTPPDQLGSLPGFRAVGTPTVTRRVSAQFRTSQFVAGLPVEFILGTVNPDGTSTPRAWHDPITETPAFGTTEMWEIHNFTAGSHAIHIHLIQFNVINREPLGGGTTTPPDAWEAGDKDTIIVPGPGITRVKMTFDRRSLYVWHCHFLDHEDHGMMRPFEVR